MTERIVEPPQRKLFDIGSYIQDNLGVDKKSLIHDLAAIVIEVDKTKINSERVLPVILARMPGKVVNVRSKRKREILDQYSDRSDFDRKEKRGGEAIRSADAYYWFTSPRGGPYKYETARVQVGRVRNLFGVEIIQAFAFPCDLTQEECLHLSWRMEEFSKKNSQELDNSEDLRDKIIQFDLPEGIEWMDFLRNIVPEMSDVWDAIQKGKVSDNYRKILSQARKEVEKVLAEIPVVENEQGYIHIGARLEWGMENYGHTIFSSACGLSNTDLLGNRSWMMPNWFFKSYSGLQFNEFNQNGDQYGSLDFECPHCHEVNTREHGKLMERCLHCGSGVRCV